MLPGLKVPKLVYSTSSKYNSRIDVYKKGDYYHLSVDNIVQSISWQNPSVKNRVWGRMVDLVKEQRPEAKHILLFGLGGGTMVQLFTHEFPDAHITVVEIDEVMVEVAKQYFELGSVQNLTVVLADAMRVIAEPTKYMLHQDTFDVAIVDIYCGDKYPDLGKSGTFFGKLKWFVKEGGLVVFNRIYIDSHQAEVDEFIELVEMHYKSVASDTIAGRTNSDNILIYGEV